MKKKKNSCTPSYPKKIFMHLPEKIHLRETLTKKNAPRNLPTPHITFLIVRPYVAWAGKQWEVGVGKVWKRRYPPLSRLSSLYFSRFLTLFSERLEQFRVFDVPMRHKLETFLKIFFKNAIGWMHSWGPTPVKSPCHCLKRFSLAW